MGLEAGSPYLVAVGCCLVHHVKNPERAGPLHAAPRARTCREEAGEGGVRGEERVRLRLFSSGENDGLVNDISGTFTQVSVTTIFLLIVAHFPF